MPRFETLWLNARIATFAPGSAAFGLIADAAIASSRGTIAWLGPANTLEAPPEQLASRVIDAGGRLITPGLVDAHTHLIFGGDRIADFERRMAGESYTAAAAGGSGIAHTVEMTRAASDDELLRSARRRLRTMIANGTTTVEIKSGYGLDPATEVRMLRLARQLGREAGITVRTTFLGAHVVPREFAGRRDAYLDLICETMLPQVAAEGLADAVDVFCDRIAFSIAETERVLTAARALGLPVKLHADQIADTGAAALAARYGALSADHLEQTDDAGIVAMAAAGTVAVLLPGAFHYLRETVKPPVAALRAHGVPMALATDCNPGTSPMLTLPTAANLGCVLFGMTPNEALAGITREGARALGLDDRGVLRAGARADFALWDATSPVELCYWLGGSPCAGVVAAGEPIAAPSCSSRPKQRMP